MSTRIKIVGTDAQGWSIDKDRFYTEKAIKGLNFRIVKNSITADIIYNVWYSYILKKKFILLRWLKGKRKIVNIITNDPEDNNKDLKKYLKFSDYWVCANQKQSNFLLKNGINENQIFINPFYVDEKTFTKTNLDKKELASALKIDYSQIRNKLIIASFQRDSLGNDLTKSKWHKNPELLVDILKELDMNKFVLLLAGPRRHFLINQCRKLNIPYLFVGDESFIDQQTDDTSANNLSAKQMNLLYNLADLYLVTSVSEGGPKAIIESTLTKTAILSTPVGFAPDLLNEATICKTKDDFLVKINRLINDIEFTESIIQENYRKISGVNNFDAYKQRIKHIIETISNDR